MDRNYNSMLVGRPSVHSMDTVRLYVDLLDKECEAVVELTVFKQIELCRRPLSQHYQN